MVLGDKIVWIPVGARDRLVVILVGPSAVVLPVVSVVALTPVVFNVVEGAPK